MIQPQNEIQNLKMKRGFWLGKKKQNPALTKEADKHIALLDNELREALAKKSINK